MSLICSIVFRSFNADVHPGNILVVEDGQGNHPSSKLGLIDFGQCKHLQPEERVRIAKLILSVADNETDEQVAAAFRKLNIETKNDCTQFLAAFARLLFGPFRPEHTNHDWHKQLHEMDRVTYFPNELSMVYRCSLLLRGLAISLQVNPSVGEQWRRHAQQAIHEFDNS